MTETLKSVGIDIGTSTTQLVVSDLTLENRANPFSVPRIAITDKKIVYRSGIHFTPLLSDTVIDARGVRDIVAEEYRRAGLRRDQVQTGAVIITGETARKENAREVLAALSEFAGDFVVATAGPDLESILAARGAGADEYSKENHTQVLHYDIGGGTSNLALYNRGRLCATSCLAKNHLSFPQTGGAFSRSCTGRGGLFGPFGPRGGGDDGRPFAGGGAGASRTPAGILHHRRGVSHAGPGRGALLLRRRG